MDLSTLPEDQRVEFQKRLERETITSAIERWRSDHSHLQQMGINTSLNSTAASKDGSMGHSMGLWLEQMVARIREEHSLIDESEERTAICSSQRPML